MTAAEKAREVVDVVVACLPNLAGRPPEIQGAALADMLAKWLAGHPKQVREELLRSHVDLMRDLIPVNANMIGTEP